MIRSDYWCQRPPGMSKLPGPLRLTPSFPFAGRLRELATLRPLIPRAAGEGLRFVLVGGEAGSGKSRLVREFAQEAAGGGAIVLYGACDAVVRRPYRPFVEALDQLVRSTEPATLRPTSAPRAESSRGCCPIWRSGSASCRLRSRPIRTPSATACTARWEICSPPSAAGRRLVLVIEDGHWADTPTLLLLRHLARGAPEARMLVITTFRDTEAEVPQALSATHSSTCAARRVSCDCDWRAQRRGDLRVRRARGRG